jgi:Coenzyme PQQ synthesis protein D (PqqD)
MSAGMTQASNLEVHEVPDGYIVYQKERDRVHYLNKTAAIIFELCDGTHRPQDLVEQVAKIYALDPSAYDEIRTALDSLVQEGLVLSSSM